MLRTGRRDEAFIDYAVAHASLKSAKLPLEPGLIVVRSSHEILRVSGAGGLDMPSPIRRPSGVSVSLLPTWPVTQLPIDALAEAVADR